MRHGACSAAPAAWDVRERHDCVPGPPPPVLQQLFEPPVDDGGLELCLVADRGGRNLLDQLAATHHHLFGGRDVRAGALHGWVLRALFYGEDTSFPAEALHACNH